MKYENNRVKDIKIAYIGGGSRGWAWGFMSDLSLEESISGTVYLYDIDIPSARANEIIGNKASRLPEAESEWNYMVSGDIDSALKGADFVIISIHQEPFFLLRKCVQMYTHRRSMVSISPWGTPWGREAC